MSKFCTSGLVGAMLVGLLTLLSVAASASDLDRSAVVDGMLVYLGVMPANVLSGNPDYYNEHNMQCPVAVGRNSHHVMVALFDRSSGRRITDADVTARVSPLGLVGPEKTLGPVSVADAVAYCNYFGLSARDTYDIKVWIQRPGVATPVAANFRFTPFGD